MKKTTLLMLLLTSGVGFAQSQNEQIQRYLAGNHQKLGLSRQDVADWFVESEASSSSTKINNYYVKQRYQGIEIFNAVTNFSIKNGEVINVGNRFVGNVAAKVNTVVPVLSVTDGFLKAQSHLKVPAFSSQIATRISDKEFKLTNGTLADDPVSAELVFQEMEDQSLRLAWDYTFYTSDYKHLWSVRIDAVNGKMLENFDLVLTCNFGDSNHKEHNHSVNFTSQAYKEASSLAQVQSGSYRVYPYNVESPNHGNRELLVTPHNAVASPYGWHDTNGVAGPEFTITRGNNAWAKEDIAGNNGTGTSPNGGLGMVFDFPYGGTGVQPSTYTSAATTNLFYMNNIMHDIMYQYGFNEINGNFQQNNYGKGGTVTFNGDPVLADAQDGSGVNNANFATPVDGQSPRMQMFLWNVGPRPNLFRIHSPASLAGGYFAVENNFTAGHVAVPIAPAAITADLALFDDGIPDNNDGCTAAINGAQLNGKIVLIRRGSCDFVNKVMFAQNAGAVGVIMINNLEEYMVMGGSNAAITIPAILVSQSVGNALIAAMQSGPVNVSLTHETVNFVNSDGDFDNGVISHEYGHGISSRLTGGPANASCLTSTEQMGEGWSDFFAYLLQIKAGDSPVTGKGIATFLANQPTSGVGIRQYKYSTDMGINPLTYGDTNGLTYVDANGNTRIDVHAVGTVWATMLWDLTWAYINKYGYDPNIYTGTGGNNKVLRLIIDALKLQPCNPSFVSGRDAIIAADQATTGGQDFCIIWDVFARRGLGVNASAGMNSGVSAINDQVEDFTTPPQGANCTMAVDYFQNEEMIKVYPNPSNGQFNVFIGNYSGKVSLQVYDINGRNVYNQKVEDFNIERTINLKGLQSGMYILKIEGDNLNYTKKVILN
ncbi:T9SS-dependent M36 family metallopeptidase [Flavobacterium cerinum]|uniref:T9SS-dependent M36 family metallopeptidase n=1 Tax=Flavobacterium cerinum TaxID=2502784 RepID=A0ABY5IUV8_9FLAO|nr:T9SS-dependent M36 family metallopeptidase [Flavobacterium cerinum]UUC46599.1 T9SS-dependent M36 family metallopeptidase [Flavobacterium cerinum]